MAKVQAKICLSLKPSNGKAVQPGQKDILEQARLFWNCCRGHWEVPTRVFQYSNSNKQTPHGTAVLCLSLRCTTLVEESTVNQCCEDHIRGFSKKKKSFMLFFFSSSHYCNKQLRNFYLFARWALRKFTFTDVKYIPIELYAIGQTKSSMTTSCVWIRQMVCVPQRASQTGGQSVNMGWIYSSLNNGAGEGFQQPPRQLVGLPDAVCCDQISQTLKL